MTLDATDMSTPVTRGEMRAEFAAFEVTLDQKLERLEQRLDQRADQKLERLEQRFDQKLERLEQRFDQKFDQLDQKFDHKLDQLDQKFDHKLKSALEIWGGALLARIDASEQRLLAELARHAQAHHEAMVLQVSIIDEKYADLPRRVRRLEDEVLPPGRR